MKPRFSFNDALAAPFALMRRRPLYVFAWGLMMVAMMAAIYSVMLPIFAAIPFGDDSTAAMDTYIAETSRFSVALNGMNLVMYLIMLILWTAAGRATLSPQRGDRFLFLRVGMDEVRVAVAIVATFAGWYIALLVLILLGVGLGIALWAVNEAAAVITLILYGLAVLIASIWAFARVSLIAPACLILGRFAFAEGWKLARGQVWKLIGLHLLIWVVYVIATVLIYAVVAGILAAGFFGQGLQWPTQVNAAADLEPLVRPMIIPALLAAIPLSFGFGWIMTFYAAPAVVAARQLLDGTPISQDVPADGTLQSQ